MSVNISRRQFLLGMLGASAVGTLALKLLTAEMVEADAYASRRGLHRCEIGRINSMMKFRCTEVLPPFERPVPLQVFRGAQWKHEQRPPYHARFA